jgi:hypothetical protein
MLDFARIWQAADRIVYSKSLQTVSTRKTRLAREFDPPAVRDLKAQLPHDGAVGGPTLAACAMRTGLVGEYRPFAAPIIVGGGQAGSVRVRLKLLDERGFDNGRVHLSLSRGDLIETSGSRRRVYLFRSRRLTSNRPRMSGCPKIGPEQYWEVGRRQATINMMAHWPEPFFRTVTRPVGRDCPDRADRACFGSNPLADGLN